MWGGGLFSNKLMTFIKDFDAALAKKEIINGRNTFKVNVHPTMEEVVNLIATMDPGIMDRVGITDLSNVDEGVRNLEITLWVDELEFLPVRADFLLEAQTSMLNPAGSGVVPVETVVSMSINFDFTTPFNIVLPSAALDAVELV